MDKATLLLAAGHTLRRGFVQGMASGFRRMLAAIRLLALLACISAMFSAFVGCVMATFFVLPFGFPLIPAAWLGALFGLAIAAYAILFAISIRDGSFASSMAACSAPFDGLILTPWRSGGMAMAGLAMEPSFANAFRRMAKVMLLGLSMPIQALALLCAASGHIWRGSRILLRRLSGAGAALERLANASPEIVAQREAAALARQSNPGDGGGPPPRL